MILKKDTLALHDENYVKNFITSDNSLRLKNILRYVNFAGTKSVLDVGCGSGELLGLMPRSVETYVGVDFSAPFIEAAKLRNANVRHPRAEFQCSTLESFYSSSPAKFDMAFLFDVSEHLYDDDYKSTLNCIHKLLNPQGRLIIHTPNLEFFIEAFKDKGILTQFPEHIAVRNMADTLQPLRDFNFEIVKSIYIPHYNRLSTLKYFSKIPLVGKYFNARIFIEAQKRN